MPYGRQRGMGLRPIKSDKHESTWSNLSQNASSVVNINLITAVNPADKNTGIEVEIGSAVKGIYLEFQFSAEAITSTKIIHWKVAMSREGQTFSTPATYYQADRSQILKRGMEMLPKSVNTIIKRIIYVPIPRSFQRMKDNNQFFFSYIASSSETINSCGIFIYKEYS